MLKPVSAAEPALVSKLALEQEVAGELALDDRQRDLDTLRHLGLEGTQEGTRPLPTHSQ